VKLFVLALDGMDFMVFERLRDLLPNIAEVAEGGRWGVMRAVDPPITVPAWVSMFTGLDPGELGIYGFRHLRRGDRRPYVVTSLDVSVDYVWERLGLRSIVVGLPPGYPPRRYGVWISDFMTPPGRPWTYPPELASELGDYIFDVEYRTENRERAFGDLLKMVELRFRVAERLLERPWDIFILHEIGTDRVHHMFQKFWDFAHPQYESGNPHEDKIPSLYSYVDSLFGRLRKKLGGAEVLVISDHGNQAQRGVLAINQLLWEWGLLEFTREPRRGEDIDAVVDWGRSRAVAWGGYYARVFLNAEGGEREGLVKELKKKFKSVKAPWGYVHGAVYEPREIYRVVRGDAPDLMIYLDGLRVRPVQTVGYESPWLEGNDRGPDDSLHSFNGFYAASWLGGGKRDIYALDVAKFVESIYSRGP